MARQNSIIKLRGTINDMTFVKSPTYGDHVRNKRFTFSDATVNSAFQKASKVMKGSNVPAKIFNDSIAPYRKGLEGGQLWQRLVSMFQKQMRSSGKFDFARLEPFEVQDKYPLSRIVHLIPTITVNKKESRIDVSLRYNVEADFGKVKNVDGHRLTLIGLFFDLKKKSAAREAVLSDVLEADTLGPVELSLDIPKKATTFVICVKIEGCERKQVIGTRATMGLRVIGAGKI